MSNVFMAGDRQQDIDLSHSMRSVIINSRRKY